LKRGWKSAGHLDGESTAERTTNVRMAGKRLRTPLDHAPRLFKGENRIFGENVDMDSGFFCHFLENYFSSDSFRTQPLTEKQLRENGAVEQQTSKGWLSQRANT
jgi:hypothetical protein